MLEDDALLLWSYGHRNAQKAKWKAVLWRLFTESKCRLSSFRSIWIFKLKCPFCRCVIQWHEWSFRTWRRVGLGIWVNYPYICEMFASCSIGDSRRDWNYPRGQSSNISRYSKRDELLRPLNSLLNIDIVNTGNYNISTSHYKAPNGRRGIRDAQANRSINDSESCTQSKLIPLKY